MLFVPNTERVRHMENVQQEEHMSGKRVAFNIIAVVVGTVAVLFLIKYLMGM